MRKYTTAVIDISSSDTVATADFPLVEGRLIGFSTTAIGTRSEGSVQVVIKEGSSELHRPVDINFSETVGRGSFEDGVLLLGVDNPAQLSAQINIPAGSTETFSVEVLLVSETNRC